MPERNEAERIHDALAKLCADADKAWQGRRCLTTARFWKVALGLGSYEPSEKRHVLTCPDCRRRDQEVNQAARNPGGRTEPGPMLTASQALRPGHAKKGDKADLFPGPQRLTFAEDSQLSAEVTRDKTGNAWLELRHGKWRPGTLVRVVATVPDWTANAFGGFALLHADKNAASTRFPLVKSLFKDARSRILTVQTVPLSAVTVDDVPALRAAFVESCKDDPDPAAWYAWATNGLDQSGLSVGIQEFLEEVRDATLPPERGAVQ